MGRFVSMKRTRKMTHALALYRFARQMDFAEKGFGVQTYRFWLPNRAIDFKGTNEMRDFVKKIVRSGKD